jgi:adenine phosphoribosyltransferase
VPERPAAKPTILDLKAYIRDIPDFPKPGIVFKDITPLLKDAQAFAATIDQLASSFKHADVDAVLGAEARGFIVGAALAYKLGVGFLPVRKPGKLPFQRRQASYSLEYGKDSLEVHIDAISKGQRILLVDDLLATGGTMEACCRLVEELGGIVVGCAFIVELAFLNGRQKLAKHAVNSLVSYASE